MKFIDKCIKYYTKNLVRIIGIFVTGLLIITSIIYIKYKPSYKVTLNGQVIGYVENKDDMQKMVEKYQNDLPENVAYITINSMPQYELEFVSGDVKDNSEEVLLEVANSARVTYKSYVISYNKQKLQVNTEAEASEIIKSLKVNKKKIKVTETYSERMMTEEEIEKALAKLEKSINKNTKKKKTTKPTKKVAKVTRKRVTTRSTVKRKKVSTRHKTKVSKVKHNKVTKSTSLSTGKFTFPVRGCSLRNVNNKHYPSYSGHTGIDVNINVKGKSVVAADDGVVITSKAVRSSNGGYRSYGEYIEIRHDDGKVTLYAHMSPGSRKVSVGDRVYRGQVIGKVGKTGNATGVHLHFEVKINGKHVNPFKYL